MSDQVKFGDKLKGARVLILGGSSGLGFGVAEGVLEAGAGAVYISSSSDRVKEAVQRLQQAYPSKKDAVHGVICDLSSKDSLESNIANLLKECGKLDHIVHTAGDRLAIKPLVETDFDGMLQAGMTRFFAPLMLAKQAKIQGTFEPLSPAKSFTICTGSINERPRPDWTVVASYAGGHLIMAKSLCLDLAPVRVNTVAPGGVETEMWNHIPEDKRKELLNGMAEKTTVKQVGQVVDVAESFLYLMRDRNVAGVMVSTNGGTMLL